jgi:hypothetical protein
MDDLVVCSSEGVTNWYCNSCAWSATVFDGKSERSFQQVRSEFETHVCTNSRPDPHVSVTSHVLVNLPLGIRYSHRHVRVLTELATKAAVSHQLRLHMDTCPLCRREKDADVPVAVPNPQWD